MVDLSALAWRKSSFSGGTDGTNCVEVALTWRRSSFSGGTDGTECVEVALPHDAAALRDSKNTTGPILLVPQASWATFLHTIDRI